MGNWYLHLSFEILRDFAYGSAQPDSIQLDHCQTCDECASTLRTFRRDAEVIEKTRAGVERSHRMSRRLRLVDTRHNHT
jgi:hypothetical protein